ncbi:prepilin-type N-terminal cleavage/methylation domain-containing protein [Massilia solisilvae]|uniref:Prepilin-type N-terminal cleavage/methylation domain-containing protein n=1 Tax=Massilia solisilvae TaxID=1811225 RepID=A0ABT2BML9_9BURK|nr:prepilin-type N-terminal cleavage/methylation domain-containing protein [Massilia solisilvae]MCS0609646.1 prepilin-type N-terminal cleavage/methylation domain-containing protein [Massilia solisilvae]
MLQYCQPRRPGQGFTMVELIVVLVLVGILGAIGAVRFFDRRDFDATNFSDQARSALRYAQTVAIAQHRPVYAVLDSTSVRLCFVAGATCPGSEVAAPFAVTTGGPCTTSKWYCLRVPQGVGVSQVVTVAFDALGRPTDSGGTLLAASVTTTVSAGTMTVPITLEAETGYVH